MKPIKIKVTEADALVVQAPTITSGMAGLMVEFEFDETWDGFTKTAVFKAGNVVRDVVDIDASCTVPPEVLEQPYRILRIGVYGVSADGEVTIPTVWATMDEIRVGTDPSGDESMDPTLPVWQQILNKIGTVKTVNGIAPDETGNVQVEAGGGESPLVIQLLLNFHPDEKDASTGYHEVENATPWEDITAAVGNKRPIVAILAGQSYGENIQYQSAYYEWNGSMLIFYFGRTYVAVGGLGWCDNNF